MAALFFLAFAYFAVGQAAVKRNNAQTAADAAALAAARADRDTLHDAFLAALLGGDIDVLRRLLGVGPLDDLTACGAARQYAAANDSTVRDCGRVGDLPAGALTGYSVSVATNGTVGDSVVNRHETRKAYADATAVVSARCGLDPGAGAAGGADAGAAGGADAGAAGGSEGGGNGGTGGASPTPSSPPPPRPVVFDCLGSDLTIDPGAPDFTLRLSDFYSVHLIK